jgi:uncharacterized damage-inducible protein DinB
MAQTLETLLTTPEGFRSREVARFLWQMDEQRRALLADMRGLAPDELAWQPAPGMNTIGMLLAHIAYAEAHLTQVGLAGEATGHAQDVIGITEADEGMPLPRDGRPPAALRGRALEFFDDLLARARARAKQVAAGLADADLDRVVTRARPDGTRRVFNVGWVLYHILEHEAGHHGQINLLRHLWKERGHVGNAG